MLRLRDELELKLEMLAFPVDICGQKALQGQSALQVMISNMMAALMFNALKCPQIAQGAFNVALSVLNEIEEFEASLVSQDISVVQPPSISSS